MKLRAVAVLLAATFALSAADYIKGNSFGSPSAPIMIEVFSDFQCPACKLFHDTEVPRIMQEYVVPGKAYLIYRYYPLDMHPYGRKTAEVVAAAAQLGKYDLVSNFAFAKQTEIANSGKPEEIIDNVLTAAEQQKLKGLIPSPIVRDTIEHDLAEARSVPVSGTPTLLVTYRLKRYTLGGRQVMQYEWVKALLDDLLKK